MRTEFKHDCMQRRPFHLLRKTSYLILIMSVPDHSSISYASGIGGMGGVVVLCFLVGFFLITFLVFQSRLVFLA